MQVSQANNVSPEGTSQHTGEDKPSDNNTNMNTENAKYNNKNKTSTSQVRNVMFEPLAQQFTGIRIPLSHDVSDDVTNVPRQSQVVPVLDNRGMKASSFGPTTKEMENSVDHSDHTEQALNQSFLQQQVPLEENLQQDNSLLYQNSPQRQTQGLQLRYVVLQQEMQDIHNKLQLQNINSTEQDSIKSNLNSLKLIEQHLVPGKNVLSYQQTQQIRDRIVTLQRALENYSEILSSILKILQQHSQQIQEAENLSKKQRQISKNINECCSSFLYSLQQDFADNSVDAYIVDFKNFRQEVYDIQNNIRQKSFSFLTSLLNTNHLPQAPLSADRSQMQNFQNFTQQENPLFDQQNKRQPLQDISLNNRQNMLNQSNQQLQNQQTRFVEPPQPPVNQQVQQPSNVVTPQSLAFQEKTFPLNFKPQSEDSQSPMLNAQKYHKKVRANNFNNHDTPQNNITRQLAPPRFEKFSGEVNAQLWLNRFERTCKRYEFSDEEKLDEALNQMSKHAERWVIRNQQNFLDYETFRDMFLNKFITPYEVFQHQLMSEKQLRSDSYATFLDKLNCIAGQGDVDEQTIKVLFINNMYRKDVAFHLERFLLDKNVDSTELCRQAQLIQNGLEAISNQNKSSSISVQKTSNNSYTRDNRQRTSKPLNNYQNKQQSNGYNNNNNNNTTSSSNYQNKPSYQNNYNKGSGYKPNTSNNTSYNKPQYNKNTPKMAYNQPVLETQVQEENQSEVSSQEQNEQVYDGDQEVSDQEIVEEETQQDDTQPVHMSFLNCHSASTLVDKSVKSSGSDKLVGISSNFDPKQSRFDPLKFDSYIKPKQLSLMSQTEVVKPITNQKNVQQYFNLGNVLKNQNIQVKFEDLLLNSDVYYNQFKNYCENLKKVKDGEVSFEEIQHLNLLKPQYKLNNSICEVTVPEIRVQLYVKVKLLDQEVMCFVDTGANKSCVSKDFLLRNNITKYKTAQQTYQLMNGTTYTPEGFVCLKLEMDPELTGSIEVAVVQNTQFDFVFGLDLYEAFNCYTTRQQLFYKNPYKNRYNSLDFFKQNGPIQVHRFLQERTNPIIFQLMGQFLAKYVHLVLAIKMSFQIGMYKTLYQFSSVLDKQLKEFEKYDSIREIMQMLIKFIIVYNLYFQKSLHTFSPVLCNLTQGRTLVKKKVQDVKLPKFPIQNKYQLMIVDFPWKYETDKYLKPSYNTLDMSQLKQIPITKCTDTNCVFLFWVTGPKLQDCFRLIQHFRLKYITCMSVWRKVDKGKLYCSKGSYTKPNYEYVLLASKGDISQFRRNDKAVIKQELQAQVQAHSKKPPTFYKIVEKIFKTETMKCIELFARIQKHSYLDLYGDAIKGYFTPSLKQLNDQYINEKGQTRSYGTLAVCIESPKTLRIKSYFQKSMNLHEESLKLLMSPFQDTDYDFEVIKPILQIVTRYVHAFAFNEHEVGTTNVLQHTIELEKDSKLKAQNPYRLTGPERDFVKSEIQNLEKLGYIVRDVSPHAAPIVVVKKENGKFRMCIDFRDLNKYTVPHHWPLPQIDVLLTYLYGKKVFSKLDLRSGFFNVSLKPEDQYKTSFVCCYGQYKYTRMPFGLRNAPSTFQHAMEEILRDILYKFCLVYIDDVIVFSRSVEEHYQHLRVIFGLIVKSGIKLHPEKCQIGVSEVEFLGHKVAYNRVYPKESKTAKIETLRPPKTVKQLQSFLGFTSYYRKFIKEYSKVAKPLQVLIQKEVKYQWEEPQQKAFDKLKKIVTSQPHLKIPDLQSRFYLCTDFSTEGLGAVLSQVDETTKQEKPIEYASRTLNVHEQKYGSYEGECLAVIWAFAKFRHYLLGKEFTLYTDNKALSWILGNKNPSPKIARWLLVIQEYNFVTIHRSGKSNGNADSLSRLAPNLSSDYISTLTSQSSDQNSDCKQLLSFLTFNQFDEQIYYENEPLYKPCDIGDVVCGKCQSPEKPQELLICESCGQGCHLQCHQPVLQQVPQENFYCQNCQESFSKMSISDLDLTVDVTCYEIMKNPDYLEKLSKTEQVLYKQKVQGYFLRNGQIYKSLRGQDLLVPTLFQRLQILEEFHENHTSHAGARRTIDTIQTKYYWPRMEKQTLDYINKCIVCIATNKSSFKEHNDLYQTEKGIQPFQVWSIDLITGLPATKQGNSILLVMIDCFSKWSEVIPLSNKESITVARHFYESIVCRYGKPLLVRSDQGKEFLGSFEILLDNLGVKHVTTSPYYAKSNGQAERMNRTLIQCLKKTLANKGLPLNSWDVILPHVLFTMRFCTNQTTRFSPFQILFGQPPNFMSPLDFSEQLNIPPVTQEFLQQYISKIMKIQKLLFPKVKQNIEETEINSQNVYRSKLKTFQESIQPGQFVFKNVGPRTTKLQLQATGPYKFVQYINSSKTSCEIQELETLKIQTVSTANIVPVPQV